MIIRICLNVFWLFFFLYACVSYQIIAIVEKLKKEIEESTLLENESQKKVAAAKERLKTIEKDMDELSSHREDKLKQLQVRSSPGQVDLYNLIDIYYFFFFFFRKAEIKKAKAEVSKAGPRIKEMERDVEIARQEKREFLCSL